MGADDQWAAVHEPPTGLTGPTSVQDSVPGAPPVPETVIASLIEAPTGTEAEEMEVDRSGLATSTVSPGSPAAVVAGPPIESAVSCCT